MASLYNSEMLSFKLIPVAHKVLVLAFLFQLMGPVVKKGTHRTE